MDLAIFGGKCYMGTAINATANSAIINTTIMDISPKLPDEPFTKQI